MTRPRSTGALSPERHAAQNTRYAENRVYDYVFIGTGNAALSCAALLAKAGYKVCLLEAHDVPGGYAQTFKYGDYAFCAQVHYVWGCGPGGSIHELMKKLELDEEVTYELYAADGYDHMATPDGKITKIPYGLKNAADSVARNYPEQRAQVSAFFDAVGKLYDQVGTLPDPLRWTDYLMAPFKYSAVLKFHDKTLEQAFDMFGLSREVRAVLSANAGDFLLPPERLSMLLYAALMGGYSTGAYYPTKHYEGHINRLAQSITDTRGCDIFYETRVTEFDLAGGRLSRVVCEDGKEFRARRGFICNMDPQRAAGMIGLDNFPKDYQELLQYEYSDSALMVYLGIEGIDLRDYGFGRHNTWRVTQWDMNKTWREQNDEDNHTNPWLFISTPTLITNDGHHTPPGGQIMELGTSLSYRAFKELKDTSPAAYKKRKRAVADKLLDLVAEHHVPNIRDHVKLRLVGTPTTNEDYVYAPFGNAYGSSLTPWQVKNRLAFETPIDNLYWCNATAGYPSFCGTASSGMNLYMQLTGDRFVGRAPPREQRERWAIDNALNGARARDGLVAAAG